MSFSMLLAIDATFLLIACVLYVIFGQVTVRRLRKNPDTKHLLGLEFVSGWDIINVAQALAIPRSWSDRLSRSPLGSLYADSSVLFEHTTRFDQILGSVFYWILMVSGGAAPLIIGLNSLGIIS